MTSFGLLSLLHEQEGLCWVWHCVYCSGHKALVKHEQVQYQNRKRVHKNCFAGPLTPRKRWMGVWIRNCTLMRHFPWGGGVRRVTVHLRVNTAQTDFLMPNDPNPDSCHEEPGPPGAIGREGHHHHNDLGYGLLSTTSERPEMSFWRPQLNCWQLGVGGPGVFCFYFSDFSTPIALRLNAISLHTSPTIWNVPCGIPHEARTANFKPSFLKTLSIGFLITFQSVEFFYTLKIN